MNRQSNNKNRDTTAAIYLRLSREDGKEGESNSIASQKKLLTKNAHEKGYTNIFPFVDDGVTGTTMNRQGFNEMIAELEKGHIGAVFVKDLSRLGRNYIGVGKLTEEFFPEHDIRLVSVADNIDTADGEDELAPIRNLFNEFYSRDISKKKRISNRVKGAAGVPLGYAPYGYMNDPDKPRFWVIDPEAAVIVRRIFDMTLEGMGTTQIADKLTKEGVLTPVYYWKEKDVKRPVKPHNRPPHHWNNSTVASILAKREYAGDVINFKTYSKSYKNKKRIDSAPEDMMIFEDVHEPIIDRAVWERIAEKRKQRTRKRPHSEGEKSMFSGFLVCADCGHNLHFHFNQKNRDIQFFNCSNYKGNRGTCETTHYIGLSFWKRC